MAENTDQGEKTEEATPRRRDEAREKGQVAFSTEIVAAGMLIAVALGFVFGGDRLGRGAGELVVEGCALVRSMGTAELSLPQAAQLLGGAARHIAPACLLLLLPMLMVGLVVGYAQVGFRISPKAVGLDPARLNPVKGLQRVFSARGVVRTTLAALKITLVMAAVGTVVWHDVARMSALAGSDLGPTLAAVGQTLVRALSAGLVVILALALLDLVFQRQQHSKDLRMTKKEVRDELKTTDGDPQIKGRIRAIQRELAQRRMMADVPNATVVVTNPTHYAVALAYDDEPAGDGEGGDGGSRAPRVVAKGVDEVARTIKRVAREAGVFCYEAPPLARALHREVEIGDEIPEQLFQAVAGVLAYVYRVQGRAARAGV